MTYLRTHIKCVVWIHANILFKVIVWHGFQMTRILRRWWKDQRLQIDFAADSVIKTWMVMPSGISVINLEGVEFGNKPNKVMGIGVQLDLEISKRQTHFSFVVQSFKELRPALFLFFLHNISYIFFICFSNPMIGSHSLLLYRSLKSIKAESGLN